jgi:hypothetical protein
MQYTCKFIFGKDQIYLYLLGLEFTFKKIICINCVNLAK